MKRIQLILTFLVSTALGSTTPVGFDALLANPRAYHQKQVCLVGFARVDGESFVLFENKFAATKLNDSRAVSVAQRIGQSTHDRFNNHWVKITGTVEANAHGLWNFPCEILLEKVEAVAAPTQSGKSR